MPGPSKDTIYIDIDDEITGIIDKVRNSKGNPVALVLPKRAGVFQSIVNMKLLKRAADGAGKNLVLITSEAGLIPLAGASGIHVAKSLSSKPEVPQAPKMDETGEEAIDEAGEVTAATAGDEPVGKLAGTPPPSQDEGVETVELPDDEGGKDKAGKAAGAAAVGKAKSFEPPAKGKDKPKKAKKGGKFSIPDFNKFRLKLLAIGGIVLLLIIGLILGMVVLPKATISIKTDATKVPVELDLNLSTAATQLETENNTLPAKQATQQKTYSQQVPTTGQKNQGSKASGSIKLTNCGSDTVTIPSGSGFSANGQTFVSTQDVTVPKSSYDNSGHGFVCNNNGTGSVNVQAQSGGTSSNMPGNTTFSLSSNPGSVSASGGTSGGTDNIVKTVNQNDINAAKSKISAANDDVQKKALQKQLNDGGYFAIISTFAAGTPNTTQSTPVGAAANDVTVTETITYNMFGVHEKDLNTLVDNAVKDQIDTSKQTILTRGLNTAVFAVNSSTPTTAQLTMQTNAEAGPEINVNNIKENAAGKKPSEVKALLRGNPDVQDVTVKLSPFWVSSVPKKESKIKVKIAEPTISKGNSNANNP